MAIITISRGTFGGGKEFAENLARKLDYRCISRETLSEEAIKAGVPVGKLQTAMVKPPRVYQRLGPQREFYLSFATSLICKYALEGNLVYHGHTGHLLLPGIPHILRVRVLGNMEYRIGNVMERLKLSREKAAEYITNVDADRDRWVRFLYGIDWHNPTFYDLVVNLDQMGISNATTALCAMAQLPDFQLTPASKKALNNLYLASRARFLLALSKQTNYADFKVTASDGIVQVTCMPQYAETVQFVSEVLSELEGCKEVHCTIAGSNILWLSEKFDTSGELFQNVVKVARKWDAAVEIMRYAADENGAADEQTVSKTAPAGMILDQTVNGGIEDDVETPKTDSTRVDPVLDALLKEQCYGGSSTIYGDKENLITTLGHRTNYSLVVIDDLFLSKPETVRKRLTSDLRSLLADRIKAPVVEAEELKQELKFRVKDFVKMGVFALVAFLLFYLVFTNQATVLNILAGEEYKSWRILVIIAIVALVPAFAYTYGTITRQILRFFKLG